MSQERLATRLKVAAQQVQKYESAVNRVRASKLFEIADHLQTMVAYFFEGPPSKYAHLMPPPSDNAKAAMNDQDFLHLIEALARMEKGPVRQHPLILSALRRCIGADTAQTTMISIQNAGWPL